MANEDGRRATALARPLVGQSFVQLCVGAGEAQLNFTGDVTITLESPVGIGPDVGDDGALTVTIGGTAIHCDADPSSEAWNYTGPGGRRVVSMPGGGLAVWDAV